MFGAALAQEIHALPQLELLFAGINMSNDKFCRNDLSDVAYFYDIHLRWN